jgi:hypothetical protein
LSDVRERSGKTSDPWSAGGETTRAEVREIFAQHAAPADPAAPELLHEPERRKALPGLLRLPAFAWRQIPALAKAGVVAAAVALAVVLAIALPPAFENAAEDRLTEARERAANRERIRRELVRDQAPRRTRLPRELRGAGPERLAPAVAGFVERDAQSRAQAGDLDGPITGASCAPVRRADAVTAGAVVFTCLAETRFRGTYLGRRLVSGYRFRARVDRRAGAVAWCEENPRPLHPDQEEFVQVPLSRACTG